MSRTIILRVSGSLLCLAGVGTALSGWLMVTLLTNRSLTFSYPFYIDETFGYEAVTLLGLGLMIVQARENRHWLGWLGIGLALLGLAFTTVTIAFALSQPLTYLPPRIFIIFLILGSPLFSLGLVFWALDMPNTNHVLLVQRAAMGLVAVLPLFQNVITLQQIFYAAGVQNQQFVQALMYVVPAVLKGLFLIVIGVCVWLLSKSTLSESQATQKPSFADSSVDMVVSPIPPEDL